MYPIIHLPGKELSTYALCAVVGGLLAGTFVCLSAKKRGEDVDDTIIMMLLIGVGVLFGSHMLYGIVTVPAVVRVFQRGFTIGSFQDFLDLAMFLFGGGVFYGGLGGGALAAWLYARYKHKNKALYADLLAPAIPLFHFFGRIGCFLGGCCYGVEAPFGFVYTQNPIEQANGVVRFPVQLVESAFNLLLFLVLYYLLSHGLLKGRLIFVYLLSYAPARFILEFFRGDTYRGFLGPFSTSQWISLLIVAGCLIFFIYTKIRKNVAKKLPSV